MDSEVLVDYEKIKILQDDIYIFMSDGVYESLESKEMIAILSENDSFDDSADKLLTLALENGK